MNKKQSWYLMVQISLSVMLPAVAMASDGIAGLEKVVQSSCYDSAGSAVPCSGTEQFEIAVCPTPKLLEPEGIGDSPRPVFSWKKSEGVVWYQLAVYSEAESRYEATQWHRGSRVCQGDTCSAQLYRAIKPGTYWWWVNTWSSGDCKLQRQPGGKYKQYTFAGCEPPVLGEPSGTVPFGTRPPHTFSTANAEWVNLQIYSTTLGITSSQWVWAPAACPMGNCSVKPALGIMPRGHNWWWVNTYSRDCGYQNRPGGNIGSYTVE